uniref:Ig-like domain-containing protein n=1 Tax=Chelydra serpentina TaxID=8475 RepID=A0A8C3SWT5_CHESE
FCNIYPANFSRFDCSLNWYKKINSTYTQKIAEWPGKGKSQMEKFNLLNHTSTVEIRILNLTENDTGEYYCGLITFSSPNKERTWACQVPRSMPGPWAELHNAIAPHPSPQLSKTHPPAQREVLGLRQELLAEVLWLVLYGRSEWPVTVVCSGLEGYESVCGVHREAGRMWMRLLVKMPPLVVAWQNEQVTTYTVDYGVLEFQQEEHTEAPVESHPPDNTEYATIVFPEEKPPLTRLLPRIGQPLK